MNERRVGNALTRRRGVRVFGSALLRCELARDGARGFGCGIGCSGVILMTRDGRRQVGIGQIGVGTVTVVTHARNARPCLRPVFTHQSLIACVITITSLFIVQPVCHSTSTACELYSPLPM